MSTSGAPRGASRPVGVGTQAARPTANVTVNRRGTAGPSSGGFVGVGRELPRVASTKRLIMPLEEKINLNSAANSTSGNGPASGSTASSASPSPLKRSTATTTTTSSSPTNSSGFRRSTLPPGTTVSRNAGSIAQTSGARPPARSPSPPPSRARLSPASSTPGTATRTTLTANRTTSPTPARRSSTGAAIPANSLGKPSGVTRGSAIGAASQRAAPSPSPPLARRSLAGQQQQLQSSGQGRSLSPAPQTRTGSAIRSGSVDPKRVGVRSSTSSSPASAAPPLRPQPTAPAATVTAGTTAASPSSQATPSRPSSLASSQPSPAPASTTDASVAQIPISPSAFSSEAGQASALSPHIPLLLAAQPIKSDADASAFTMPDATVSSAVDEVSDAESTNSGVGVGVGGVLRPIHHSRSNSRHSNNPTPVKRVQSGAAAQQKVAFGISLATPGPGSVVDTHALQLQRENLNAIEWVETPSTALSSSTSLPSIGHGTLRRFGSSMGAHGTTRGSLMSSGAGFVEGEEEDDVPGKSTQSLGQVNGRKEREGAFSTSMVAYAHLMDGCDIVDDSQASGHAGDPEDAASPRRQALPHVTVKWIDDDCGGGGAETVPSSSPETSTLKSPAAVHPLFDAFQQKQSEASIVDLIISSHTAATASDADDDDESKKLPASLAQSPLKALDAQGDSALHIACRMGCTLVVRELLRLGADANEPNGAGWTPLTLAAREGHVAVIHELVKPSAMSTSSLSSSSLADPSIAGPKDASTPLPVQASVVPADLSGRNLRGQHAVHVACIGGHLHALQTLLSFGASHNVKVTAPSSPTSTGTSSPIPATPAKISAEGDTPLIVASRYSRVAIIEYLLDRGAPANARGSMLRSALHWAAATGQWASVAALVAGPTRTSADYDHADPDAKDEAGKTPSEVATNAVKFAEAVMLGMKKRFERMEHAMRLLQQQAPAAPIAASSTSVPAPAPVSSASPASLTPAQSDATGNDAAKGSSDAAPMTSDVKPVDRLQSLRGAGHTPLPGELLTPRMKDSLRPRPQLQIASRARGEDVNKTGSSTSMQLVLAGGQGKHKDDIDDFAHASNIAKLATIGIVPTPPTQYFRDKSKSHGSTYMYDSILGKLIPIPKAAASLGSTGQQQQQQQSASDLVSPLRLAASTLLITSTAPLVSSPSAPVATPLSARERFEKLSARGNRPPRDPPAAPEEDSTPRSAAVEALRAIPWTYSSTSS